MAQKAGEVVLLIFLLLVLGAAGYFLYTSLPGKTLDLIPAITQQGSESVEYGTGKQFYENMRFSDSKISYSIESQCDSKKVSEIEETFDILERETLLEFYPVSGTSLLTIYCSDVAPEPKTEGFFVAGEGGPTEVINASLYNVILKGEVSFYRDEKCDTPHIALHEILHALGFDHNNNPNSILYPTLDCKQVLDDYIVSDINTLYSVPSLADLKISDVSAVKSGAYLSFDIEMINQGLRDASNVKLGIYSETKLLHEIDLEDIDIGTKKFLNVENLKIPRSTEKVIFNIDHENSIQEIFENNNKIELVVED